MDDIQPIIYKARPKLKRKIHFIDAYKSSLVELFYVNNPQFKKGSTETEIKLNTCLAEEKIDSAWIYYPKQKVLVHTLAENNFFLLRTARNRDIITAEEQKKFRKLQVGIAGLSVGSAILDAVVVSGGPKKIKIADFDSLEVTNLNRIRAGLLDIGQNKTHIAAGRAWELDPFARLELYDKGLDEKNITKFLLRSKLDAFIDEMDSLALKIQARLLCKKNKIPVLMATDNGDSVIIDVERFDLQPKREIFHGLLGQIKLKKFKNLNYKQWLSLATKIVGPEYLTNKMRQSILSIGKALPAVPQLGASAAIAGAAMVFCLRRMANDQPLPSGRYLLSLEEKLDSNFNTAAAKKQRQKSVKNFVKNFTL